MTDWIEAGSAAIGLIGWFAIPGWAAWSSFARDRTTQVLATTTAVIGAGLFGWWILWLATR